MDIVPGVFGVFIIHRRAKTIAAVAPLPGPVIAGGPGGIAAVSAQPAQGIAERRRVAGASRAAERAAGRSARAARGCSDAVPDLLPTLVRRIAQALPAQSRRVN